MSESLPSSQIPAVSHLDALPVGTLVAEFEIVALLGVGGFGMVYRAFDHSLHRPVAIKEYMPAAMAGRVHGQSLSVRSSADDAGFKAGLQSFIAEARLLAQFDHPSLVKVFRFWEANNTAYMVMPLYSGMTLKQARNQMVLPPPEAWLRKVLWSVLGALRTLHDGSTLHRDVSPDNIFIQDVGPPVLLDLGAARLAIGNNSQKHTAVLKVNYAPIEQYGNQEDMQQGPWTDLYSLGAVVHSCMSNVDPLPSTFRVLRDRMRSCAGVAKTLHQQLGLRYSSDFVKAIDGALAIRPEDRPQSIDAFIDAMKLGPPSEGLATFDWRAELGDIWQGPMAGGGQVRIANTINVSDAERHQAEVADTVFSPHTQPETPLLASAGTEAELLAAAVSKKPSGNQSYRADARHSSGAMRDGGRERAGKAGRAGALNQGRVRTSWALGLLAVMVVVSVAYAVMAAKKREKFTRDDIITELSDRSALAAKATAAEAAASQATALATASAPALPATPLLDPSLDLAAAPAIAEAASAAAVPALSSASAAPPAGLANGAKSAAQKAAARQAKLMLPPLVSAPVEPPMPAPAPAAAPVRIVETPRPAPAPKTLCADANFFTRSMCMHQECQKPSLARTGVCVEFRRKLEESRAPEP